MNMQEMSAAPLAYTRTEVILGYVTLLTRETPASIEDYSEDVVRVWQQRTPLSLRSDADFNTSDDSFKRRKANGEKIRRWMNPDISARPSLDVEEALVLALPQPYLGRCLRDLSGRYGGLFIELPEGAVTIGVAGELLAGVGETCRALAPVLSDNSIDEHDDEDKLLAVRAAVLGMQAKAAGILHEVDAALNQQRARHAMADGKLRAVR